MGSRPQSRASSGAPLGWLSKKMPVGSDRGGDGSVETSTDMVGLVAGLSDGLAYLDAHSTASAHDTYTGESRVVAEEVASRLARIKCLLFDERTSPSSQTPTMASTAIDALTADANADADPATTDGGITHNVRGRLIPALLSGIPLLPFEARKDLAAALGYLLVFGLSDVGQIIGGGSTSANTGMADDDISARIREVKPDDGAPERLIAYFAQNFAEIMEPIVRGHNCTEIVGSGNEAGDPPALPEFSKRTIKKNAVSRSTPDVALHCGSLLRSVLRHPRLFSLFVSDRHSPRFVFPFLDRFVHQPNFEVAGDCLETVRVIFTGGLGSMVGVAATEAAGDGEGGQLQESSHDERDNMSFGNGASRSGCAMSTVALASEFLRRQYSPVIEERFNSRLLTPKASYVTRRASIQLLGTILLTRSNYPVMMRYIANRANLVVIMLLLRDASPHVTLDTFHVFKIFVANPKKTREVTRILVDNKVKLVRYLETFHSEREKSDVQFRDEKWLVISTLENLTHPKQGTVDVPVGT